MMSCDSSNPSPEYGYYLLLSAHPDSIPNTGTASSIHAIVGSEADSSQVGGMSIEFDASFGNITAIGTSSATDPTGLVSPYVYYSCNDSQGTATITANMFRDGGFILQEETEIVIYEP
jgi:hypothetical protein